MAADVSAPDSINKSLVPLLLLLLIFNINASSAAINPSALNCMSGPADTSLLSNNVIVGVDPIFISPLTSNVAAGAVVEVSPIPTLLVEPSKVTYAVVDPSLNFISSSPCVFIKNPTSLSYFIVGVVFVSVLNFIEASVPSPNIMSPKTANFSPGSLVPIPTLPSFFKNS